MNGKSLTCFVRTKPRGSVVFTKPLANVAKHVAYFSCCYLYSFENTRNSCGFAKARLSLFFSESDYFISNKCMNYEMLQVDLW